MLAIKEHIIQLEEVYTYICIYLYTITHLMGNNLQDLGPLWRNHSLSLKKLGWIWIGGEEQGEYSSNGNCTNMWEAGMKVTLLRKNENNEEECSCWRAERNGL